MNVSEKNQEWQNYQIPMVTQPCAPSAQGSLKPSDGEDI